MSASADTYAEPQESPTPADTPLAEGGGDPTPRPWTDSLTPMIPAGSETVLLRGKPPMVPVRVISEPNFQLAKKCVNAYGWVAELDEDRRRQALGVARAAADLLKEMDLRPLDSASSFHVRRDDLIEAIKAEKKQGQERERVRKLSDAAYDRQRKELDEMTQLHGIEAAANEADLTEMGRRFQAEIEAIKKGGGS